MHVSSIRTTRPTTRPAMTRVLTATLPDGSTYRREIRVRNTASCDYDYAVCLRHAESNGWRVEDLTRYQERANQLAAEWRVAMRAHACEVAVVRLTNTLVRAEAK